MKGRSLGPETTAVPPQGVGGSLLALVLLLLTAGCWQKTTVHTEGELLGFRIGATKQEAFQAALGAQAAGTIVNLLLVDELSMDKQDQTYDDRYKGQPILAKDFRRVSSADTWQVNRAEGNRWLRLMFSDGLLERIEEHQWTGPTD